MNPVPNATKMLNTRPPTLFWHKIYIVYADFCTCILLTKYWIESHVSDEKTQKFSARFARSILLHAVIFAFTVSVLARLYIITQVN